MVAGQDRHTGVATQATVGPWCPINWLKTNFLKTELELGRRLRLPQEGPCECDLYRTCSKFVTTPAYADRLRHRVTIEDQLIAEAQERGREREVERHNVSAPASSTCSPNSTSPSSSASGPIGCDPVPRCDVSPRIGYRDRRHGASLTPQNFPKSPAAKPHSPNQSRHSNHELTDARERWTGYAKRDWQPHLAERRNNIRQSAHRDNGYTPGERRGPNDQVADRGPPQQVLASLAAPVRAPTRAVRSFVTGSKPLSELQERRSVGVAAWEAVTGGCCAQCRCGSAAVAVPSFR